MRLSKLYAVERPQLSAATPAIPVGKPTKDKRLEIKISSVQKEVVNDTKELTIDATIRNLASNRLAISRECFHMIDAAKYLYSPVKEGEARFEVSPNTKTNVQLTFRIPAESKGLSMIYSDLGSNFLFKEVD